MTGYTQEEYEHDTEFVRSIWEERTGETETFDRWFAEVERAAAEKVWDKGLAAAMEAEIKDDGYGNTQYPANPYRRNEGEK